MAVNSRDGLKQYALRALGAPVLEINVDDDQLEDRIDEALDYWRLYHYEGIEQIYMKQKISASVITLFTADATSFSIGETIRGTTSGATAQVCREIGRESSGNTLLVRNVTGTFLPSEHVVGTSSGHDSTLSSITLGEYDKRYIDVPDYVWGVTKILSIGQASSSKNMFDLQYQLRLNDLYDLTSTSIIYYKTVMSHLDLLDFELNGPTNFRFNKTTNKLYLDINWASDVVLGNYIIIQSYRALDPNEFSKVWNETWMKRYVIALFKKQWAVNIKKFSGIQLPGGVTLDGDKLYQEAIEEIEKLEDELQNKSAPLDFFLG